MALAAQVSAWGRRWPKAGIGPLGLQAGIPPVTFGDGQTLLRVKVEILINGTWVDVSSYVLYEQKVVITRGKADESSESQPAQCTLTLLNSDRRFSPRNPAGPYFGYLGRNVKIRVSANPGSNEYRRFTGRVSEWPPSWTTGQDRRVNIEANGVLRRLQQGVGASYSAMRRFLTLRTHPVAYWPLEGGSTSNTMYDLVNNRPTELVDQSAAVAGQAGAPLFGSADLADGSDRVANIAGSWTLGMKGPTDTAATGQSMWIFAVNFGKDVRSGGFWNVGMRFNPYVQAKHLEFLLYVQDSGSGRLDVIEADQSLVTTSGPTTVTSFTISNQYNGVCRFFEVDIYAGAGNDVNWTLFIDNVGVASGVYTASFSGATSVSAPYRMSTLTSSTNTAGTVGVGHFAMYNNFDDFPEQLIFDRMAAAIRGHAGETPTDRFTRVCGEEGIDYVVSELISDIGTMGAQQITDPLDTLRSCADAAEGRLDEDLDDNLRLSSRSDRYDQAAMLVLDYDTHLFQQDQFEPTDDDRITRNDWTLSRPAGAFPKQWVKTSGKLNISTPEDDPTNGVGRYNDSGTLNVNTDDALLMHAAHRVARGTVDKIRLRVLPLMLERDEGLIPPWVSRDPLGGRVILMNPPDDIGVDALDQVIDGYQETLDQFTWHVEANTTPNDINQTGHLNRSGFLDSRGSTLDGSLDTSQTGVDLTISTNATWVHNEDYNIIVGGEVMTVTGVGTVTGGPYPVAQLQTLTVVRSVNGVVKSHSSGEEVHVFDPFRTIL